MAAPAEEELVLLARDDKTASLAVITPAATQSPSPRVAPEAVTLRLVVEQSYRCGAGAGGAGDDADTVEDVACRVPVAELVSGAGAAVDRAFEALVAGMDHPVLRPEVAPEAGEAAALVRARCAAAAKEEGMSQLGGAEFRLRIVLVDSLDEESDPDPEAEPDYEEEVGSDLEFDEECWARGGSGDYDAPFEHEHGQDAALSDDGGDDQFSARPYDGAFLAAQDGGPSPSDGTLLLSGFEARSDGPELGEQLELTARHMQRLVRLAFGGGDVEGDEAYQRAVTSGEPVTRVTRAVMLDQGLRSARQQQRPKQPTATSPRGMPPRMRTGW